jgi:ribonuclease HI
VSHGIKRLLFFGDSKVVIEQVNKEWDCVKDMMDAYCAKIHKLEGHFEGSSSSTPHGITTSPPTYSPN